MIVSLQEAKEHLRVDTDAEDDDITLKIQAASNIILDYLKKTEDDYEPGLYGTILTPTSVKMACLILVGILYRDRDGEETKNWNQGYLPFSVTALIYPLRDPSLA